MRTCRVFAALAVLVALAAAPVAAWAIAGQQTYVHTGSFGASGAQYVAADKFGNVYVSDDSARLRKYSATGSPLATIAPDGGFGTILGVACDRWARVYVAERWPSPAADRIRVFDGEGTLLHTLSGVTGSNVDGVAVALDDHVYATSDVNWFDRWTPRTSLVTPDRSWQVTAPVWDVSCDATGNVLAGTIIPSGSVHAYTSTGTALASFGSAGSGPGQFNGPSNIDVDAFGQPIVGDGNNNVQVFGPDYGFRTLLGGLWNPPMGVAAGRHRDAFVIQVFGTVERFETTQTTLYTEFAGVHRYNTAVKMSRRAFPYGADTVVFATGLNFPDALGAAALAGAEGASLMLAGEDSCPG